MCLSHHGICMLFLFQSQTRKTVRQGRPPVVSTVPPQVLTLMVRCRVCSCVCALALFCVCVCVLLLVSVFSSRGHGAGSLLCPARASGILEADC